MFAPIKNVAASLVHALLVGGAVMSVWQFSASVGQTAPITVPNFSFEDPAIPNNSFSSAPIPDWVYAGTFTNAGVYDSSDTEYSGTSAGSFPGTGDGDNFALTNLTRGGTAGNQAVSITSAAAVATVLPYSTYTLTVAMGNRIAASENGDLLSIELLVNDVVVPASTFSVLGSTITSDMFEDFTTNFVTGDMTDPLVGGALKVRLRHSTLAGSGVATGDFDNVRLDVVTVLPPAPEPSAFALLGFGMLAFARRTRRAKSCSANAEKQ